MGGKKTWIAAVGVFASGVAMLVEGLMGEAVNPDKVWQGILICSGALGMVGLGHKIEKSK